MFDAISRLFDKAAHKSRSGQADGYPFDFDASLRFVRLATGIDFWPTHSNYDNYQQLGCVSGFMPQQDATVWATMFGKDPFGPIASALPENLQYQITIPGLNKQMPQY